jgi:hypothetical protein
MSEKPLENILIEIAKEKAKRKGILLKEKTKAQRQREFVEAVYHLSEKDLHEAIDRLSGSVYEKLRSYFK